MKVFEEFDPSIERMTAQQLAEKTGSERLLLGIVFWLILLGALKPKQRADCDIVRIMRTLVTLGIFLEIGEETYTHNARSKRFTNPTFRTVMRGL